MTKIYKANSVAHIVVVVNGQSRRVSLAAKTGGGSTFRTDDTLLQEAIEKHYRFGELFVLAETIEDKKPSKKKTTAPTPPANAEEKPNTEDETPEVTGNNDAPADNQGAEIEDDNDETEAESPENESGLVQVSVTDFESARDYLSDKFGISRTKIRSQKAVIEAAKANGIEFVGF